MRRLDEEAKISSTEKIDDPCKTWPIQARLKLADSLFRSHSEGVCITDNQQKILQASQTLCRITGYSLTQIAGKRPNLFSSGIHDKAFFDSMWESINENGQWQGEMWNRNKEGSLYAIRLNISAVHDAQHEVSHYIGIMSDITQQKIDLAAITKSAHIDTLTGLPNRLLFTDRLIQAISQADRNKTFLAVCFMDLDNFKAINDMHGHQCGDAVLKELAIRLDSTIRAGDTAARLGGDEFILLLMGLKKSSEYAMILKRIVRSICQPITLPSSVIFPTASIGIAIYPADANTPNNLVALADSAMYRAKAQGGNRVIYHHKKIA
ncbi:diguanylate cyclase [Chromobacterium subtsugae]|uniref:Diguanylate cyclase n=1 Tax=Chromobacterium subtsugae TaxID=251747 RepID=A0ABS7FLB6_9NEIS|nr:MULTISPECIES: GGDEF domain-containing protein [Chromobacterium]MBW7569156.1 diguanylate cyclase [Chromobacterium subtsugae]MBW8290245.1 diguanylate cyclase [Chromobacterium subtsugae]WSE89617.1 diguanylate cyclase [Chromobacterium subtsugae]WVH57988.1 diguanylate cyclase [Chromobacterium subtsugae]